MLLVVSLTWLSEDYHLILFPFLWVMLQCECGLVYGSQVWCNLIDAVGQYGIGDVIQTWCFVWVELPRYSSDLLITDMLEFECWFRVFIVDIDAQVGWLLVEECGVQDVALLIIVLYFGDVAGCVSSLQCWDQCSATICRH